MPDLTPLPTRSRRLCECGRLASYTLAVKVGWPAKPASIALCTACAALEAKTTPRQLLAASQPQVLCPSPIWT